MYSVRERQPCSTSTVPALSLPCVRAKLVNRHALSCDGQPMMTRLVHELPGPVDRAAFAIGQAFWIGRPAEQFERSTAGETGRHLFGGGEQAADDLDAD